MIERSVQVAQGVGNRQLRELAQFISDRAERLWNLKPADGAKYGFPLETAKRLITYSRFSLTGDGKELECDIRDWPKLG